MFCVYEKATVVKNKDVPKFLYWSELFGLCLFNVLFFSPSDVCELLLTLHAQRHLDKCHIISVFVLEIASAVCVFLTHIAD